VAERGSDGGASGNAAGNASGEALEGAPDGARRLTLLRHGRAASPVTGGDDHERSLVDSGRQDLVATLGLDAVRADLPDRVLCSTARRTVETAHQVLESLGLDADRLESDRRLYLASPETILEIVAEQDALDVNHLMIVGHNPGLEMLAGELDARATSTLPTSGLCRFARRAAPDAPGHPLTRLLFETFPG